MLQLHSIHLLHKQLVSLLEKHDLGGLSDATFYDKVHSVIQNLTQSEHIGNDTNHVHDHADPVELLSLLKD